MQLPPGADLPRHPAAPPPLLCAIGLASLTLLTYRRFLDVGFGGSDSLALIETSRLTSLSDLALLFTRPVMAGTTFAVGETVYRPLVSVTFGLDYAIWGLNPLGYHLTNLALHTASTLLVWRVLNLLGLRWWSSVIGAAVFSLHPLVVVSLPVIARRDSLVPVTTVLGSLVLLLDAERSLGRRGRLSLLGSLLLAGLALVSKESAYAAVGLLPVVFVAALRARGADWSTAIGRCRTLVPFAVLALLLFLVRLAVLGHLGSIEPLGPNFTWDGYTQALGTFTRDLIWSFAWLAPSTWEFWPILAGYLLLGLAAGALALPRSQAALATAGLIWLLGFALFAIALRIHTIAWLAYFALVGIALLWAAGLEGAIVRLRELDIPWRHWPLSVVTPALFAVWLGFLAGAWLGASPAVRTYEQWQIAGEIDNRYIQAMVDCVAAEPRASQVRLDGVPTEFDDGQVETSLLDVTLFADYTVNSVLKLAFPSRAMDINITSYQTLHSGPDQLRFTCTTADGSSIALEPDVLQ